MKVYGQIYLIANKVNDFVYIGQTVSCLDRRLCQHRYFAQNLAKTTPLAKAIRELGIGPFKSRQSHLVLIKRL